MKYLAAFWRLLMTPSDHSDQDPSVEAGNQTSHMFWGGVIAAGTACAIYFILFDEMPQRLSVGVGIVVTYALVIELAVQGWRGEDTFKDTFFVAWGATVALVPFEEIGVSGAGLPVLTFNPYTWVILVASLMIAFALHMYPKIKEYFYAKGLE